MEILRCFSVLNERKVRKKVGKGKSSKEDFDTLLAKLQHSVSSTTCNSEPTTFDLSVTDGFQKNSRSNVRVMSIESPVKAKGGEAYEGVDENENENSLSIKKEVSNIYHQLDVPVASKESYDPTDNDQATNEFEDQSDRYSRKSADTNNSGHAQSFEDFRDLSINPVVKFKRSRSMTSHCSADRLMWKRHSSSQVLPSGSKKLWWKLFLWSHRNIHRTFSKKSKLVQGTLEPKQIKALRHMQSSASITTRSPNQSINDDDQRQSRFQNQWFAFSTKTSSYARVDAWVKDLEIQEPVPVDDPLDDIAGSISFPPSPDASRSMIITTSQLTHSNSNIPKEILLANSMVQSLNPASTVAHISGIGIKSIPVISHFSNLRSVNLSNNFIVTISPGCLPKSVQTLNLSRNKISTIEGLKELTRLRVLDLSNNCISRIGQGLSSCTIVKELYLAGNKISDVEGLHRLFKLTVLDLSFNKITTTKALGQLVANYNSLQALNLLGNAIQRNIGDEQLNKAVSGLLPKLVYLNKQPIKAKRAMREILTDSVAKAAIGNSKKRSYVKRSVSQGGSSSSRGHRSSASVAPNSRIRRRR